MAPVSARGEHLGPGCPSWLLYWVPAAPLQRRLWPEPLTRGGILHEGRVLPGGGSGVLHEGPAFVQYVQPLGSRSPLSWSGSARGGGGLPHPGAGGPNDPVPLVERCCYMRGDEPYGNFHRSGVRWCCCRRSLRCTAVPRGRVCLDVGQALLGLLLLNHVLVGRVEDIVDGTQNSSARVGPATPPVDPATALHPQEELVHGRQGGDDGQNCYEEAHVRRRSRAGRRSPRPRRWRGGRRRPRR